MTPDALKVATDILRELGMEDVARWVEHPEAVRLLLLLPHYAPNETCRDCGADVDESHGQTFDHPRNPQWCRIAAAWHTLCDPRGAADIERAHEEALRENRGPGHWVVLHRTPMGRAEQAQQLLRDGLITTEQVVRILAYPEDMAGGINVCGNGIRGR